MLVVRSDRGFSLVEVLVAMLVLSSAAVGMAGLVTIAAVSIRHARVVTSESILALDKLEQLRSLAWGFDASGARISDFTTDLSVQPIASGGSGLRASPVDSLDRNSPGYVDFLDGAGRWVGTGTVPPRTATFVRRWHIAVLTDNSDTLIFQVLVTTVGRGRTPLDALISGMKTRSAA